MPPLAVCTTFPNDAWRVYARLALETFAQFWPRDALLFVYLDDDTLVDEVNAALAGRDAASRVRVGKGEAHAAFLARNAARESVRDFRFQACRFSHKIASLKAAMDELAQEPNPPAQLLWLDADVVTTALVTYDWLAQFMPQGEARISYLGRGQFQYSECGFVGFALGPDARAFIDDFWSLYETDALFAQTQWHDSWLFDRLREQRPAAWFHNISSGVGGIHVWLNTRLIERLDHWKGPVAKRMKRSITDQEAHDLARQAQMQWTAQGS
jgi:hypothetical protein